MHDPSRWPCYRCRLADLAAPEYQAGWHRSLSRLGRAADVGFANSMIQKSPNPSAIRSSRSLFPLAARRRVADFRPTQPRPPLRDRTRDPDRQGSHGLAPSRDHCTTAMAGGGRLDRNRSAPTRPEPPSPAVPSDSLAIVRGASNSRPSTPLGPARHRRAVGWAAMKRRWQGAPTWQGRHRWHAWADVFTCQRRRGCAADGLVLGLAQVRARGTHTLSTEGGGRTLWCAQTR